MPVRHKSKLEDQFAKQWNLPHEAKRYPYTIVHHYTPDWMVTRNYHIETKGLWLSSDRTKIRKVLEQHPELRLLMVFQNPHKTLGKGTKTTYAQYCTRHNIDWCAVTDLKSVNHFIKTGLGDTGPDHSSR